MTNSKSPTDEKIADAARGKASARAHREPCMLGSDHAGCRTDDDRR